MKHEKISLLEFKTQISCWLVFGQDIKNHSESDRAAACAWLKGYYALTLLIKQPWTYDHHHYLHNFSFHEFQHVCACVRACVCKCVWYGARVCECNLPHPKTGTKSHLSGVRKTWVKCLSQGKMQCHHQDSNLGT